MSNFQYSNNVKQTLIRINNKMKHLKKKEKRKKYIQLFTILYYYSIHYLFG